METQQLEAALNKLATPTCHVLGVFARDQLPKKSTITRFPACLIANTDSASKPGEHWVAFWFESKESTEFFDSYGFHPSYFGFTLTCNNYNTIPIQSMDSSVCGEYSLYYLYMKSQGSSLSHIASLFDPSNPLWNDKQVRKFFTKFFATPSLLSFPSSYSQCCISRKCCISRNSTAPIF